MAPDDLHSGATPQSLPLPDRLAPLAEHPRHELVKTLTLPNAKPTTIDRAMPSEGRSPARRESPRCD